MVNNVVFFGGKHREVLEQLGDREPSTALEAKAVLEHIRVTKGHLDDEVRSDLENLEPRNRDLMLQFVERQRETEAAYTKSISEQLYSSKYRFLFELIQNADDSSYRNAKRERSEPYMRLIVTPDTLVIETNEDGFTRKNVEAVCATGKSSKKASASDDHIGEKGFGFKSVFSIAHEVHIQSGIWSFSLKHRQLDDGLGMVTPLDAPSERLPDRVTTRITLYISDTTIAGYQRLLESITDIPETTIFFLQRLQKIEACMSKIFGPTETITITKGNRSGSNLREITRSRELAGTTTHDVSAYFQFWYTKSSMPEDHRRKDKSDVRIDLAFPVDPSTMAPKLSERGQHLFAYLPLQRLPQIQFLIQSDFITSASRESVMDCPWNAAICDGVAEVFAIIVRNRFAKSEHALKYSWLDYLPIAPMERPWKFLYQNIKDRLKTEPVLQSWNGRNFKRPSALRRLPNFMLHDGQPILQDLPDECYLAPEYDVKHLVVLDELGAGLMTWSSLVDRLQADLVSHQSRVKTKAPYDPWHKAFAHLLLRGLKLAHGTIRQRIRRLAIIPLAGGIQWTGAPGTTGGLTNVYFPWTESIRIPDSISLHLVERIAASDSKRTELYTEMGVEQCPTETVLSKIQETHQSPLGPSDILGQLRYLFHFHPQPERIKPWVLILLAGGITRKASSCSLYFPSENEYDMYQLLPGHMRAGWNDVAQFLSKELVELEPPTTIVRDMNWKTWLACITNAQNYPPLVRKGLFGTTFLSSALRFVLKHNATKFLGTLKAHWDDYQQTAHLVQDELEKCEVLCESGALVQLSKTYIPTSDVLSNITALRLPTRQFNLLKLPFDVTDDSTHRQWKFLEEFGVRSKPDLDFYKTALKVMISKGPVSEQSTVEAVYTCIARLATVHDHTGLRLFFDSLGIWDGNRRRWVTRGQCLWDGPGFLSYKAVLTRSYGNNALLRSFFTIVLGLQDWAIDNIVEELEKLREGSQANPGLFLTRSIYTFLRANTQRDEDWQSIRDAFMTKKLVLGENDSWHTLHTCLWGSPFALANFQDLSVIYSDLEDFFVRRLGVKKASPSMLIDEVRRMARETQPNIADMRIRLIGLGMMLAKTSMDSNIKRSLDALKEVAFLPKKLTGGASVLVKVTDDFGIPDHQRYGDALTGHDVLLDFQVDEVQILNVMFEYFGLAPRYLSTAVSEVSTIGTDSVQDEDLSKQLQEKAYALYCCAAKYKSVKALRDDRGLFQQFANALVHTTTEMSTHLVLPLSAGPLSVQSDRLFIHHDTIDGQLKFYVPAEQRQRQRCYRSQLPQLLTSLMGVNSAATFTISSIVTCKLRDLDDILTELDVSSVDWIEKPVIVIPEVPDDEPPRTPTARSAFDGSDASTVVDEGPRILTPETPTPHNDPSRHTPSRVDIGGFVRTPLPTQYPRLIEQVVRSAQRASYRHRGARTAVADTPPLDEDFRYFDHVATFGNRESNEFTHDRRIGAAGEAYIFELLSALNLPGFTRANWQSTIRGELASATRYSSMQNWVGRETADLVYTDSDGALTQYLRDNCTGGFPEQIPLDHDHEEMPIEYYLEVKSTTGACSTRFFLSTGQYKRMQDMRLQSGQPPNKVYVILRVYDLTTPNVGMKIFVDPLRLDGGEIEFEAQQWIGRTR